jgi:hypothetical protein
MTSEKQIAANRANAAKSTGPKTPETKAVSCMNALRHGLTGQVNLMPDEDRAAHDKFCAAIVESLAPEGALEVQFAQSVAEDNWRMNRGRAIETNIFAIGSFGPGFPGNPDTMTFGTASLDINNPEIDAAVTAAQVFAAAPNKFQLLSLYMQRTNRDMQKTLDRLTALQTDRKARRQDALEEAAVLYELAEENRTAEDPDMSTGQACALPAALSPEKPDQRREVEVSGFVFSIPQIQAFATRRRRLNQVPKQAPTAHNAGRSQNNGKSGDRNRPFRQAA